MACKSCGREACDVTLVAVSKTVPIDQIRALYDLGHRDFGESRQQELTQKREALPDDVRWHFVGKLQSNKAKRVADSCSWIHTLDSESQIKELAKSSKTIDGLIEINIAEEPQKSGISPQALDRFAEIVLNCTQVRLRGLMAVGPVVHNPEDMRPYFRRLKDLLSRLQGADCLSMGMSQGFEVAIQEGSTHIRVGSAIFGERT